MPVTGKERRGMALRAGSVVLLLAILLSGLLLLLAPRQARRMTATLGSGLRGDTDATLTLATAERDGAYFALGKCLAEHLEMQGYGEVSVLETAGSLENIGRLRAGTADFALIQGGLTEDLSDLAQVSRLNRQYVHVLVPAASAITEFRQLAGRRLGVGPESGGSAALARQVLGFYDFDDPPTLVTNHGPLDAAFTDGTIDAAFLVYGLFAPAMESVLETGYYRLVPLPEAEAIAAFQPGVTRAVLPAHCYGPDRTLPGSAGLTTLAVDTLLVTRADTPARHVSAMLMALYDVNVQWRARLHRLTEAEGRITRQLPLHPAANAFFSRNDPVSSDRFEIASFFLAGLVCVTSLVHYLLGRRRHRLAEKRRKVITPFFEFMLDMGEATEAADNPETLARLVKDMMAEQRRAERAWLAGALDTEHMENLYAIYNIRTRNAYSKMHNLQLQRLGLPRENTAPPQPDPDSRTPSRQEVPPGWREAGAWDGLDEGIVGEVRVRRKSAEPAEMDVAVDEDVPNGDDGGQMMLF